MKSARSLRGARPPRRSTHRRYPGAPHSAAASILANIVLDPQHVASALCQMATLAHVAGRSDKRDHSVNVAAELLTSRRRRLRTTADAVAVERLPS